MLVRTGKNDGISLLVAATEHLIDRGQECPATLISTHFHEIYERAILPVTPMVRFFTHVAANSKTFNFPMNPSL
jgi:DNA mismatch repair ATPase MutS